MLNPFWAFWNFVEEIIALSGSAAAQKNLGHRYYLGVGIIKDLEKAVFYLSLAAEQGDAAAQFGLGGCYINGEGVPKNLDKGLYYLRLAAKQGQADAQYFLGLSYQMGQGVPRNLDEAVRYYRLAVKQGKPPHAVYAQANLEKCVQEISSASSSSSAATGSVSMAAQISESSTTPSSMVKIHSSTNSLTCWSWVPVVAIVAAVSAGVGAFVTSQSCKNK